MSVPRTPDLARLRDAPWLKTPGIARIFAALASTGKTSRAVGGAVRNTLLEHPIDDVDIATAATPEQVLAAAKGAGLSAIPTGLQHGTVTLVADSIHYEVTTLRRDVATDGRHAVVAFTDDWALDASRRDFTINALYCDADGTLFDPLGGVADLAPTRVRFIGDARARIREDYLRILRFFRFSARYGDGAVDAEGLAACGLERAGLAQVSAERIRVELLKLLGHRRAPDICRLMQSYGFLVSMLGCAPSPGRLDRLQAIETALGREPDPLLRLAALALHPSGDAGPLARRLRLSGAERGRLAAICADWAGALAETGARADRRAIYRHGRAGFQDIALVAWAGAAQTHHNQDWPARVALADTWPPPRLPLTGQDVMALGVEAGPAVGHALLALEMWWMDHDFVPDRGACLTELNRRVLLPPHS